MHNKTFNPFFFEDEHARVISGEEEAIYGWTAVNFVMGTLIKNSEGTGTVSANHTYGVLEMGGKQTPKLIFRRPCW
jgi:Golgi nucleoside diphosphatase